ncbi:MAG: Gfo/Idh/MocA family oxidoreductase [Deltaproteobacteria bacterium]|nr:Gfo/Idh/MocA family oxidoreductase [Deltaproteobacteria bacterium]
MEKVKIGLAGTDFAGRLHLDCLSSLNKVEICAIASLDPDAKDLAKRYGIPEVYDDYRRLLERKDLDVIDICLPTDMHQDACILAAQAKKHIICEKPLTGYFGKERPEDNVGFEVSKEVMLNQMKKECKLVEKAVKENGVKFMYAENWVYAPPFVKLKNLMRVSGGTVIEIRSDMSHSGSQAPYSRRWKTSGGGSLMRLGAHPVSAVIHLKHYEGLLKRGSPVRAKSVFAEVAQHCKIESFQKEDKKYIVSEWVDVEDWGVIVITFEDGSNATIFSSDGVLGGVRNKMEVYMSNAVIHMNMNPNNTLEVYAPEPHIFGDEYLVERLETKAG